MYHSSAVRSSLCCSNARSPTLNCRALPLAADYLVVITKRKKVATVLSTPIYAATDFSVFPIERSTTVALLGQPDEAYLLGLLKSHLYSAPFYFTYGGYDVTTRLQEQKVGGEGAFWEKVRRLRLLFGKGEGEADHSRTQADDRFFWNKHLQRRLIDISTSATDKDVSYGAASGPSQRRADFIFPPRSASASFFPSCLAVRALPQFPHSTPR